VLVAVALLLTGAAAPEVAAQVQGVRAQLISACRDAATRAPQRHAATPRRAPVATVGGHLQPPHASVDAPRCLVRASLLNLPPPAASL